MARKGKGKQPASASDNSQQLNELSQSVSQDAFQGDDSQIPTSSLVATVEHPELDFIPSSQPPTANMQAGSTPQQPAKRGPGRPRKNQQLATSYSQPESSGMAQLAADAQQMITPLPSSALPYDPPNPNVPTHEEPAMDPSLVAQLEGATRGDDEDYVEPPQPASNPGGNNKRKRNSYGIPNKRPRPSVVPPPGAAVPTGPDDSNYPKDGPFTEVERAHIDSFADGFRASQGITAEYLNTIVQNKERKMDDLTRHFWSHLYTILPNRDHKAMQRHVRRRFHNFDKRGNWEPEEDEELRTHYASKPNAWKWIGQQLGRMPEDCRDRWRNYVICGDKRRTDHWTEEEELELSVAVHDTMREVKDAAKKNAEEKRLAFREDQDWLAQINFNDVSEKMGRSRSRLQCLQHWKAIENRELNNKPKRRVHTTRARPRMSDTTREAKAHYNKMLPGDKYEIVNTIRAAEPESEATVRWALLSQQSTMKWTLADWKYAWSRMKLLDSRDDFNEQVQAIIEWFQQNHSQEQLARKFQDTGAEPAPAEATMDGTADDVEETMAIDPILEIEQNTPHSNQQAQAAAVAAASSSVAKAKRGRKSKAYKSADVVSSSSGSRGSRSPPGQASMLNYVNRGQASNSANAFDHQHPADAVFARHLAGMQAPTAPMGGNQQQEQEPISNIDDEPQLPPIRNEGENDTRRFAEEDNNLQAEQAAVAALRGMQALQDGPQ